MRIGRTAALWLLTPVLAFMAVLYVVPLAIYLLNSFHLFRGGRILPVWTLRTYLNFFSDPFTYRVIGSSLRLALTVTALAVAAGYPLSYALHTRIRSPEARALISLLLFSPLVVSVVVRTYGWFILLANQGLINTALRRAGVVTDPIPLLFNQRGVVISLTHILMPFAIFPIYSVMGRLDASLKEAAQDLGANWWQTFVRITLPLTMPGVVAAVLICFTLALSAFVTPQLLGGGRVQVLPLAVYNSTVEINWPGGAVAGLTLLALSLAAVWSLQGLMRRLPGV
ncbi:MAG: ABC transporter permease [Armatimonadota bacterium]|nr:ABC transporter permease [Armatimonadota bacterium]MDR7451279.1 ABC transporter permease [Armatimonadota bacterium]MDR7466818.1 ABC transporter permease [Armatimonadota bacterium]MDR7492709.1 ABC transporter permease [Armatimonadota bacterium]MDR7499638.1 ABC transporter permease [Armatimonadota bacterium]